MTTNSVLDLTDGGAITFLDSSRCEWRQGAVLTIKGDLGKDRLRFGTNITGLVKSQLSQITAENYPVYMTDDGYIRNIAKGTVLILK